MDIKMEVMTRLMLVEVCFRKGLQNMFFASWKEQNERTSSTTKKGIYNTRQKKIWDAVAPELILTGFQMKSLRCRPKGNWCLDEPLK
jgi:hypothetical protein